VILSIRADLYFTSNYRAAVARLKLIFQIQTVTTGENGPISGQKHTISSIPASLKIILPITFSIIRWQLQLSFGFTQELRPSLKKNHFVSYHHHLSELLPSLSNFRKQISKQPTVFPNCHCLDCDSVNLNVVFTLIMIKKMQGYGLNVHAKIA
jgi:hypothetical protein